MQVDGSLLMPKMNPTNSTKAGSQLISKESIFQSELNNAADRLSKSKKTGIMTEEDIVQRNQDIKDASVQMEALFLKLMYSEMWKTVPKDTLFGDDDAMEIYRDMYHDELTKKMAMDGGIGLADFIYKQLTQNQK